MSAGVTASRNTHFSPSREAQEQPTPKPSEEITRACTGQAAGGCWPPRAEASSSWAPALCTGARGAGSAW